VPRRRSGGRAGRHAVSTRPRRLGPVDQRSQPRRIAGRRPGLPQQARVAAASGPGRLVHGAVGRRLRPCPDGGQPDGRGGVRCRPCWRSCRRMSRRRCPRVLAELSPDVQTAVSAVDTAAAGVGCYRKRSPGRRPLVGCRHRRSPLTAAPHVTAPFQIKRSNAAPTLSSLPQPCGAAAAGRDGVGRTVSGRPATAATCRKAPWPCPPRRQGGGARPAHAGIDCHRRPRTGGPTSTTPRDVTCPSGGVVSAVLAP